MAIRCSSSSAIIPRGQSKRSISRAVRVYKNQMQTNKVSASLIKAPLTIKVFDDPERGIVCYRDDKGELICEGYDEGPRLTLHPSHKTHLQRCAELQIPEFLHQGWFHILQDQN